MPKVEIIEKMPETEYDTICKAGVDLVAELTRVLKRHGLGSHNGFNVLVVAAAGVAAASELTSDDLANGVDSVLHMWRVQDDAGERVAIFDPAHLRPDFVPMERDPLAAN
jgi:hypothetical protein